MSSFNKIGKEDKQVLPRSSRERGERGGGGGRGKKWPQQCMHIRLNE
jgi:hypothetical protein